MKIVHVNEASATGTLSISKDLANSQSKDGHEVCYIYSQREDTPQNIRSLFDKKVELHCFQLSGIRGFFALLKLRNFFRSFRPDVVHLHSSFAGFWGRFAAIGMGISILYSPHCISFMRKDIGLIKRSVFQAFEKVASLTSCTYVACSGSEQREIVSALGSIDVVVIENAIPSLEFESLERSTVSPGAIISVVTLGGIRPQKGPDTFSKICSSVPKDKFKFIWIGDGDSSSVTALVEAGVEVTGWLDRSKAISLMSGAHIFLSTSEWEGMPVSLIEAMSLGLVPVVSKSAGNVDVVDDGFTGFIFDDVTNAVECLTMLSLNSKLWEMVSEDAKRVAMSRFSFVRFESEFRTLYNVVHSN